MEERKIYLFDGESGREERKSFWINEDYWEKKPLRFQISALGAVSKRRT